jgi:hypothetical protein
MPSAMGLRIRNFLRLKAIDPACLAPDREGGVEHLGAVAAGLLVRGEEQLHAVAGLDPTLEI